MIFVEEVIGFFLFNYFYILSGSDCYMQYSMGIELGTFNPSPAEGNDTKLLTESLLNTANTPTEGLKD